MKRITARELAVRLLYELDFNGASPEELLESALTEERFSSLFEEDEIYESLPDKKQASYISQIVSGVRLHLSDLDRLIEKYAKGWKPERISKITRAILHVALFEIENVDDAPERAAINAAVELAKKYEDEDGSAFINGILGAYSRGERESC